jgi:hypothetical protein
MPEIRKVYGNDSARLRVFFRRPTTNFRQSSSYSIEPRRVSIGKVHAS